MATLARQLSVLLAGMRDTSNNVLNGGRVYTLSEDGTSLKPVWTDSNKSSTASNPISLDTNGRAVVYGDGYYKLVVQSATVITTTGSTTSGSTTLTVTSATGITVGMTVWMVGVPYLATVAAIAGTTITMSDTATATDSGVSVTFGTTIYTWNDQTFASIDVRSFGAAGDGSTDDTAAIAAAIATGQPVYFPPGTYITSGQTITQNTFLYGAGKYSSTIKLKAGFGDNDHILYVDGDHNLNVKCLGFNGNYAQYDGEAGRDGGPNGILVPIGSLYIDDCYITGVRSVAIETGNVDYDFDGNDFAHDVHILNNIIDQLTETQNLSDCIRIYRTKRGIIKGNLCTGGLSGIRSEYYCENLVFSGNVVRDSYGDVGITTALSTDITITGNICTGHDRHGIEVDSTYRATISGNDCSGNDRYGILIGPFGPPAGSQYSGTLDGTSIAYPTNVACKDVVVSGNVLARNGSQGAGLLSCNGVGFVDNWIADNNQNGSGGGNVGGVYISGGAMNLDKVSLQNNHFVTGTYQTQSFQQENVQYTTKTFGNDHGGGRQFQYAVRGTTNLNPDPFLSQATSVYGTRGSLVSDSTTATGFARQISDSSSSSTVSIEARIAAPKFGDKLAFARFRTPDTMTNVRVVTALYSGGTSLYSVADNTYSSVGSNWFEVSVPIANSLSGTYNYDTVRITLYTGSTQTGNLNIEEISLFSTNESPSSRSYASTSIGGLISPDAQTFSGSKTFNDNLATGGTLECTGAGGFGIAPVSSTKLGIYKSDTATALASSNTSSMTLNNGDGTTGGSGFAIFFKNDTRGNNTTAAIAATLQSSSATGAYADLVFGTKSAEANVSPVARMKIASGGKVQLMENSGDAEAGVLSLQEKGTTPGSPSNGSETKVYMKADKFVIQYNDGGTVKYRYLTLTSTDSTWTYSTTAP